MSDHRSQLMVDAAGLHAESQVLTIFSLDALCIVNQCARNFNMWNYHFFHYYQSDSDGNQLTDMFT